MSRKKVSSTVWMTAEQRDALRDIKRRTGKPMAVLHREGIDSVVEQYAVTKADIAVHADQALEAARKVHAQLHMPHPKLSELAQHVERLHRDLSNALSALRQSTAEASHAREQLRRVFQAAEEALAAEPPITR